MPSPDHMQIRKVRDELLGCLGGRSELHRAALHGDLRTLSEVLLHSPVSVDELDGTGTSQNSLV